MSTKSKMSDPFGILSVMKRSRKIYDQETYDGLSDLQKHCFKLVKDEENVLIHGPGGTGKSHLIKFICRELSDGFQHNQTQSSQSSQSPNDNTLGSRRIAITASTGIAAASIGGHTIHSWSGIWRDNEPWDHIVARCHSKKYKERWSMTDLLIIDEISMMPAHMFQMLDHLGRTIRCKPLLPFGGMQVVCVGDVMQLPPVRKSSDPSHYGQYFFTAKCFDELVPVENRIELDISFRHSHDPKWSKLLSELRLGIITPETDKLLKSREQPQEENDTILYAINDSVNRENRERLDELDGDEHVFDHKFTVYNKRLSKAQQERLRGNMIRNNRCDAQLRLKEGAKIVHIVNNTDLDLVNGSQGLIVGFDEQHGQPIVDFDVVNSEEKLRLTIGQKVWDATMENPGDNVDKKDSKSATGSTGGSNDYSKRQYTKQKYRDRDMPDASLCQYPLRLAFALTGHKSQSMTLTNMFVQFSDIFEYNQAYMMLSRCSTANGTKIGKYTPKVIKTHPEALKFTQVLIANSQKIKAALP